MNKSGGDGSGTSNASSKDQTHLGGILASEVPAIFRTFFALYREAEFTPEGIICGVCKESMAGKTVRNAAGSLRTKLRNHLGRSPLHCRSFKNEEQLTPALRDLFKGMESLARNVKRQKAITPALLRHLLVGTHPSVVNSAGNHAADLIIGAFFFAMRACKYVKIPDKGKTKLITLGCVEFFTMSRAELDHLDPNLIAKAHYVRVVFVDQKNGDKFDKRTQTQTKDPQLCPVLRFGRAVQRVLKFIPGANDKTPLCATNGKTKTKAPSITVASTLILLRETCKIHGGKAKFGFDPLEIGNKSLRSGAAMGLFLQRCSPTKIMMLGRWKSRAFLDYIQPQILAWSSCFSEDMIVLENFFELFSNKDKVQDIRGTYFNGDRTLIPGLNLDF
jgi:hypothetical protein